MGFATMDETVGTHFAREVCYKSALKNAKQLARDIHHHPCTKNINIRHHFLREEVAKNTMAFHHANPENAIADGFNGSPLPHQVSFGPSLEASSMRTTSGLGKTKRQGQTICKTYRRPDLACIDSGYRRYRRRRFAANFE